MNASSRLAVAQSLIAANAFAQNLYPNPDFNDDRGTAGWEADFGFVSFQDDDASDCPASGSLGAVTAEVDPSTHAVSARGPCLSIVGTTVVDVSLVHRGSFAPLDGALVRVLRYATPDCQGNPVGGFSGAVTTEWQVLEGGLEVGLGQSFRPIAEASASSPGFVQIDEIRGTNGELGTETPSGYRQHLLLDDFEGGGVCRWSFGIVDGGLAPPGRGPARGSGRRGGAASLPFEGGGR